MRSSNTCPKCGLERSTAVPSLYKCGTTIHGIKDGLRCRGRQEAREELLQWHTGEPPVDAEYPCRFCEQDGHHDGHSGVNLFDGYASDGTYWVNCRNCGSAGPYANTPASAWRAWNIVNKPWREVRP